METWRVAELGMHNQYSGKVADIIPWVVYCADIVNIWVCYGVDTGAHMDLRGQTSLKFVRSLEDSRFGADGGYSLGLHHKYIYHQDHLHGANSLGASVLQSHSQRSRGILVQKSYPISFIDVTRGLSSTLW
jgi:hypothetical protein